MRAWLHPADRAMARAVAPPNPSEAMTSIAAVTMRCFASEDSCAPTASPIDSSTPMCRTIETTRVGTALAPPGAPQGAHFRGAHRDRWKLTIPGRLPRLGLDGDTCSAAAALRKVAGSPEGGCGGQPEPPEGESPDHVRGVMPREHDPRHPDRDGEQERTRPRCQANVAAGSCALHAISSAGGD